MILVKVFFWACSFSLVPSILLFARDLIFLAWVLFDIVQINELGNVLCNELAEGGLNETNSVPYRMEANNIRYRLFAVCVNTPIGFPLLGFRLTKKWLIAELVGIVIALLSGLIIHGSKSL